MRASTGRPPTRSSALCVVSVSGASRRATPATRMMAFTAEVLADRQARRRAELFLARLHLLDQILERGCLDDLVELRAVVRHEADALDDDVVDEPALALLEHPVLDRDLAAGLREQLARDHGRLAVDLVADVLDLLAAVQLDLGDVRALEQIAEELHELVALLLRAGRPVATERALGRLAEIEDVVR